MLVLKEKHPPPQNPYRPSFFVGTPPHHCPYLLKDEDDENGLSGPKLGRIQTWEGTPPS